MVDIRFEEQFKKILSKLKDSLMKEKVLKQISKLESDPEFGKPMRFERKEQESSTFLLTGSNIFTQNPRILF
ncbi:MAG TPA: hypothetical protein VEC16_07270 [Alphaproteobacteria bacterium]|nr:hypothetical protein [Alphaproteobacteria bacterium]